MKIQKRIRLFESEGAISSTESNLSTCNTHSNRITIQIRVCYGRTAHCTIVHTLMYFMSGPGHTEHIIIIPVKMTFETVLHFEWNWLHRTYCCGCHISKCFRFWGPKELRRISVIIQAHTFPLNMPVFAAIIFITTISRYKYTLQMKRHSAGA